jgi:hypothetical protein
MITLKDTAIVYPNRQQMLDLIRARAEAGASEAPVPPSPTCFPLLHSAGPAMNTAAREGVALD